VILLGDKDIIYEKIEKVKYCEDIKKTQSNSTVLFSFDLKILKYTFKNSINCAVIVSNIKDLIYSSKLNAKYIIVDDSILLKSQKIAENYMFDSKILAIINCCDEIENIALKGIDGIIYKNIL
jgi:hypothetical protein